MCRICRCFPCQLPIQVPVIPSQVQGQPVAYVLHGQPVAAVDMGNGSTFLMTASPQVVYHNRVVQCSVCHCSNGHYTWCPRVSAAGSSQLNHRSPSSAPAGSSAAPSFAGCSNPPCTPSQRCWNHK